MIEPIILPKSETFDPSALARALRVLAAVSPSEGGVKISLPVDRARALAQFLDGGGYRGHDVLRAADATADADLQAALDRARAEHKRDLKIYGSAVLLAAVLSWLGGAL